METVFDLNQIGLIVPALLVSVFAVLVFVFGFRKTDPLPDTLNRDLLTETNTKRKKDKNATQNGEVKKAKSAKVTADKKRDEERNKKESKETTAAATAKKETKKTEKVQPKMTPKQKQVEAQRQRKQEIKEYKDLEQDGGNWNVVVSKKKNKSDDVAVTPGTPVANGDAAAVEVDSNKKGKKKDKKDNAKEIKNRVNNELKNEENIKAVIDEIKEEITQPQTKAKKKARRD